MFEKIANWFSEEEKPNLGKKDYKETDDVESSELTPDEILMRKEGGLLGPEITKMGASEKVDPYTDEDVDPYTDEDIDKDYKKEIEALERIESERGNFELEPSQEDELDKFSNNELKKPSNWEDIRIEESHHEKPKRPKGAKTIRKEGFEDAA